MRVLSFLSILMLIGAANVSNAQPLYSNQAFPFIDRASHTSTSLYQSLITGELAGKESSTLSQIEDILHSPYVQLADMVVATLALQYVSEQQPEESSAVIFDKITYLFERTKARYMHDKLKRRNFLSCTLYGDKKRKFALKALDTLVGANDAYFEQVHETRFSKIDQATKQLSAQMYGVVTKESVFMAQTHRAILDFHKRSPEGVLDERIDIALLLRNLAVAYNQIRATSFEQSTKALIKQLEREGIIPAASLKDRVYSYIEVEYIPWLETALRDS